MKARTVVTGLLLLALLTTPILAGADLAPLLEADEVRALVAGHSADDYPDEDAVVLFMGEHVRLEPDGVIARRTQRIVLLRTELAIRALGDPRITINQACQELLIHRCRTYVPGAREVDATDHAFNPVTPDAVSRCPDRMFYQDMVITHVGIERGCVIELDTEIRDLTPHQAWLEGETFLHERYPVLDRLLTIETPGHMTLHHRLERLQGSPEITREQGQTRHEWRLGPLPGVRESDDGCGGRLTRAHLLYSTCPSWDYLVRRTKEQLEQAAGPDSLLTAYLNSIELTAANPAEKTETILGLVSSQNQSADIAAFAGLPQARTAAKTFVFRCGDPWDRAAEAMAMLNATDVPAVPALRTTTRHLRDTVPMMGQFNQLWLQVQLEEETLLLDPVHGRLEAPPSVPGPFLLLTEQGPAWRDEPAEAGRCRLWVDLTMEDTGEVTAGVDLQLEGVQWQRLHSDGPNEIADEVAAQLLPGSSRGPVELRSFGQKGCWLRFTLEGPELGTRSGTRSHVSLPAPPAGIVEMLEGYGLDRTTRSSPLFLPATLEETVTWRIRLPEGIYPTYLPASVQETSRAARFELTVGQSERADDRWTRPDERQARGAQIRIEWTASLSMSEIPAARYGELKRVLRRYQAENQRLVVLGGWPAE